MTPAECTTQQELLNAAMVERRGDGVIEHNIPAGIITQIEFAQGRSLTHNSILAYAEQGMLQIALLNEFINAPYSFIIQAWQAGWRYRADGRGFFKESEHAQRIYAHIERQKK